MRRAGSCARASGLFAVGPEDGEESFLRYFHVTDALHPALAFLLLLQQLALARHVAAVTLRGHVLAVGLDRRAGDDVGSDRGLDRDVEHLPRYEFPHPLGQIAALALRPVTVDDGAQCVDPIAVDQ